MEITLFELHFDGDTSFGPTFGGDEADVEEPEDGEPVDVEVGDDEAPDLPGPSPVAVVVGLVALVLLALGVKKALGGGDDEADEFEPEMVEIEE